MTHKKKEFVKYEYIDNLINIKHYDISVCDEIIHIVTTMTSKMPPPLVANTTNHLA